MVTPPSPDALAAEADKELPDRIGPFQILGLLGRGGMGVVYDALSPDGERVALKVIRPQGDLEHQQLLTARFMREAKILEQLSHPSVVRLLDAGDVEGVLYLAMERIEGVSLLTIRRKAAVSYEALLPLGAQLADALAHMHENGIIHRDIKPANILIDSAGNPIITDFGISGMSEATGITRMGDLLGSPGFMAPEVTEGQPPSELSDQFALGRLLYELGASGPAKRLPKNAPIIQVLSASLEIDWNRFPKVARWPALEIVLRRMLASKPHHRYANCRACKSALESLVTQDVLDADTLSEQIERLGLQPTTPWSFKIPALDEDSPIEERFSSDKTAIDQDPPGSLRKPPPKNEPVIAHPADPPPAARKEPAQRSVSSTSGPPLPPFPPAAKKELPSSPPGDAPPFPAGASSASTSPAPANAARSGGTEPFDTAFEAIWSPPIRPASGTSLAESFSARPAGVIPTPPPLGSSSPRSAGEPTSSGSSRPAPGARSSTPARGPSAPYASLGSYPAPAAQGGASSPPAPAVRPLSRISTPASDRKVYRVERPETSSPAESSPETMDAQIARLERHVSRLRDQLAQSKQEAPAKPRSIVAWVLSVLVAAGAGAGAMLLFQQAEPVAAPPVVVLVTPGSSAPTDPVAVYGSGAPPSEKDVADAKGMQDAALEHLAQKDMDGAEALLRQCVALADLPGCHRALGTVLALARNPAARAHLERYLRAVPASPDADQIRRLLETK